MPRKYNVTRPSDGGDVSGVVFTGGFGAGVVSVFFCVAIGFVFLFDLLHLRFEALSLLQYNSLRSLRSSPFGFACNVFTFD